MDYGPDWPPREPPAEPAPRRRIELPMLRPFPLSVRAGVLATLLALFVWAGVHGGYVRTVRGPEPRGPHRVQATTSLGPPAAGFGHRVTESFHAAARAADLAASFLLSWHEKARAA